MRDVVMKICPNCNSQLADEALFCTTCGNPMNVQQAYYGNVGQMYNPYDHTAEFDQKDISENKVYCMIVYLMGWIGIVIALLASPQSPYTAFHVRQAIKINVAVMLMSMFAGLLAWTVIIPIVALIMAVVFFVIQIICFFQVCSGKAVEPAIVRSLDFLK